MYFNGKVNLLSKLEKIILVGLLIMQVPKLRLNEIKSETLLIKTLCKVFNCNLIKEPLTNILQLFLSMNLLTANCQKCYSNQKL